MDYIEIIRKEDEIQLQDTTVPDGRRGKHSGGFCRTANTRRILIPQGLGKNDAGRITYEDDYAGFRNADVELSDQNMLANIRNIQESNNIPLSKALSHDLGKVGLDIEMETGTGKTYVYIKTMFELNRRYGWSKFIVVVPSIAIREGVAKSFKMLEDHFMEYYGKKARYFILLLSAKTF